MAGQPPISTDILIAGAGMAGCMAARTAADAGMHVTLCDLHPYPGGTAAASMVGTFCGVYAQNSKEPVWAFSGPAKSLSIGIQQASHSNPVHWKDGTWFLPYRLDALKSRLTELLRHPRIDYLARRQVSACSADHDLVSEVQIEHADIGAQTNIIPRTVIDATGSALFHERLSLEIIPDANPQAGALSFRLSGLPNQDTMWLQLLTAIRRGLAQGILPPRAKRISPTPGTLHNGTAWFKLGLPPAELEADHSALRNQCITHINTLVEELRKTEPLWHSLAVAECADAIGIRTGTRPVGRELLTEDAVRTGIHHPEGVAAGTWPIEYWSDADKLQFEAIHPQGYWIPAGSLESNGVENLFFAGRNLSADEAALASARVIGTCMQMGVAAAHLAVGYLSNSQRSTTIRTIQELQIKPA